MDEITPLKALLLPYEEVINKWIIKNHICDNEDKKGDLVWDIIKCLNDSGISLNDFQTIIEKCSSSNIEIPEGNMWNNLKIHFKLLQKMSLLTSLKKIFHPSYRQLHYYLTLLCYY